MTVFAYYTPQRSITINDRRAGTTRLVRDAPTPIQVNRGFAQTFTFAFSDEQSKAFFMTGRTVTARVFNLQNAEVLNKTMRVIPEYQGVAELSLTEAESLTLQEGLYNLLITYTDDFDNTQAVMTARSRPRFVLDVVDFVNGS